MWKRIAISDDRRYILNLCQSEDGTRYCVVSEAGGEVPDVVFRTEEIAPALLRSYATRQIEERGVLTNGERFVFGPHGEWFTIPEVEALMDPYARNPVPWATDKPPTLPPK